MSPQMFALVSVAVVAVLSLIGCILLAVVETDMPDILPYVLTLTVGALAGAAGLKVPEKPH